MEVYNSNEEINYEKKIDHSPLTIADKKSHETILNHLQKTDIKIISEEIEKNQNGVRKSKILWGITQKAPKECFCKKCSYSHQT